MDDAKLHEIRSWLEKSQEDLRSAEWLLESPLSLFNAIGFHCQQAAEKALKAYLTWKDQPFEKTHSVVALVGKCLPFDTSFEELRLAAITLTPYAVTSRYPGDLAELTRSEAGHAIELAQLIWNFITSRLPPETHQNL